MGDCIIFVGKGEGGGFEEVDAAGNCGVFFVEDEGRATHAAGGGVVCSR